MPAYMIINTVIHDHAAYDKYKADVPALIRKHGGRYLVRGGRFEVLEGDWKPERIVMFEFPAIDNIKAFLNDPEYASLKAVRHKVAHTDIVAVEGGGEPVV
jgi:uncharacterized protein (DUF1330 family)